MRQENVDLRRENNDLISHNRFVSQTSELNVLETRARLDELTKENVHLSYLIKDLEHKFADTLRLNDMHEQEIFRMYSFSIYLNHPEVCEIYIN